MAPPRGAQPAGDHAGQADGVPRDHPLGDRGRHRQPARPRPAAGRRPGDPAPARPHLRLRPGGRHRPPQDRSRPVGRAGAVGRHPPRGRAGAGADAVPLGGLLGHRRHLRPDRGRRRGDRARLRRHPRAGRRVAGRHRQGLRRGRVTATGGRGPRRAGSPHARRRARRRRVHRALGRSEALPSPPGGPVHHLHAPAGGRPQAAAVIGRDDAGGAGPLRERVHHLHADRQHDAVGDRAAGRPLGDRPPLR